jgi:hypothetical protein
LKDNQAALEIFRMQEAKRDKRKNARAPACANRSLSSSASSIASTIGSAGEIPRSNRTTMKARRSSSGSAKATPTKAIATSSTSANKRKSVGSTDRKSKEVPRCRDSLSSPPSMALIGRYVCRTNGMAGLSVGRVESYDAPYYNVLYQEEGDKQTGHLYLNTALSGLIGHCFVGQCVRVPYGEGMFSEGVVTGYSDQSYNVRCADSNRIYTVDEEALVGMLVKCTVGETVVVKDANSFLKGKVMKMEVRSFQCCGWIH